MKRTELKRRGRRRYPAGGLSPRTMSIVSSRQKGKCVCGCGRRISPGLIGYHHILPKAKWPELVDDPRNVAGVFEDCHANHETGATRLELVKVAAVMRGLTLDARQEGYLHRTYTA